MPTIVHKERWLRSAMLMTLTGLFAFPPPHRSCRAAGA